MLKKIALLLLIASAAVRSNLIADTPLVNESGNPSQTSASPTPPFDDLDFNFDGVAVDPRDSEPCPGCAEWFKQQEGAKTEITAGDEVAFDFPMEDGEFGLDQLKTLEAEIGVSNELTFGQKMALARAFVSARVHSAKEHIYQNKEIYLIATALAVAAGIVWYSMKHKDNEHKCGSGCKHKH